ncbi:MAG: hypothetical protein Q9179_002935 [Wetmoreana sp. 5 TL-2023]
MGSVSGLWTHPPFALFSLVDLSHQRAHDGSTVDAWWFYLAVYDYALAPQKKYDPLGQEGTIVPVDPYFKSPFIGQNQFRVAQWLENKPKSVDLDSHFFGILDKQAEKSGKVVLCRIGDAHLKGHVVTCLLWDGDTPTLTLGGTEFGDWDEILRSQGNYTPEL